MVHSTGREVCPLCQAVGDGIDSSRGETICINAILRIVFECIALYSHTVICDCFFEKDISYGNMDFNSKEKIHTLYNHINCKKLRYIIQVTGGSIVFIV